MVQLMAVTDPSSSSAPLRSHGEAVAAIAIDDQGTDLASSRSSLRAHGEAGAAMQIRIRNEQTNRFRFRNQ